MGGMGPPSATGSSARRNEEEPMSGIHAAATKAAIVAQLQGFIAGLQKRLPNAQFTLGNATLTTPALVTLCENVIAAITAVNVAQVAAKDAVTQLRDTMTKARPVLKALRAQLVTMFEGSAQALGDFGIVVKTRTPLTTAQTAAKVAKAKATRKARGTTSKKQKLAVKGNVTGVIVTPVTAPAPQPEPPAQTAPNANVAPATK